MKFWPGKAGDTDFGRCPGRAMGFLDLPVAIRERRYNFRLNHITVLNNISLVLNYAVQGMFHC